MPEAVSTRPLLDKLGVRAGARVALAGPGSLADDPFGELRDLLRQRTDDVTDLGPGESAAAGTDLVFVAAELVDELLRIGALRGSLASNGAIWVASRKGKAATIRDVDVIAAARSFDLIDNKVVAFSATHTALRLVIPLALRR